MGGRLREDLLFFDRGSSAENVCRVKERTRRHQQSTRILLLLAVWYSVNFHTTFIKKLGLAFFYQMLGCVRVFFCQYSGQ